MRRLFAGLLVSTLLVLYAVPASAQGLPCTPTPDGSGAATCTVNLHDQSFTLPGAPPCAPPVDGVSILTGNSVFHVTVNTAGDFWATETIEVSFVTIAAGSTIYTGHATLWFGFEQNSMNMVAHGTIDGNGSGAGVSFGFHEDFHGSTNASGVITAIFDKISCR